MQQAQIQRLTTVGSYSGLELRPNEDVIGIPFLTTLIECLLIILQRASKLTEMIMWLAGCSRVAVSR